MRRCLWAPSVAAVALSVAAPAGAAECRARPGETEAARGLRSVVFFRAAPDDDRPEIVPDVHRACLLSTGRSTRLAESGSVEGDGDRSTRYLLAGRFAAVVLEYGNRYGDRSWSINVADLRARRLVTRRAEPLGGAMGTAGLRFVDAALGTRGHVAWVVADRLHMWLGAQAGRRFLDLVPRGDSEVPRALDALRIDGATLTWNQDGVSQSRVLPRLR